MKKLLLIGDRDIFSIISNTTMSDFSSIFHLPERSFPDIYGESELPDPLPADEAVLVATKVSLETWRKLIQPFESNKIFFYSKESKETKTLSDWTKRLSFYLRHDTTYEWSANAFRKIETMSEFYPDLVSFLTEIFPDRFQISDDGSSVRSTRGWSDSLIEAGVDISSICKKAVLEDIPDILYYGTSVSSWQSIKKIEKILPSERSHVHLTSSLEKAKTIAAKSRKSFPVILQVNARKLFRDGLEEMLMSPDGITFLVKEVDAKYINLNLLN